MLSADLNTTTDATTVPAMIQNEIAISPTATAAADSPTVQAPATIFTDLQIKVAGLDTIIPDISQLL